MKRILIAAAVLVCTVLHAGALPLDSLRRARLDAKLTEYVSAIEAAGPNVQTEECDFLIESCTDSLVRQYVALKLYNHYFSSKVMGSEAVAIHLFDKWFGPGKVQMPDASDYINARIYADFNRSSLIGMQAPELRVEGKDGQLYGYPDVDSGRYSVLYFYDTGCVTCSAESILLRGLLEDEDYPVDFYAFYSGDDREAWDDYVSERLSVESPSVRQFHLWDPQMDSDFQRKYGVLRTPMLFLVRPDGRIAGRALDTYALAQLLDKIFAEPVIDYGSKESEQLFDGLFSAGVASPEDVTEVADLIAQATVHKGDTLMFRRMAGDMLYYLASRQGRNYREGLAYLLDRYILSPELPVWKTADDSLKVVGFAQLMDDLLSRAKPGTKVPGMKLPGTLLSKGRERQKVMRLDRLCGRENVIIFHTEGCHVCAAEIQAARALVSADRKVKVFLINVDEVLSSSPGVAAGLFDAFDLSSLPYVLVTDRKGIIQRRYETLQK